MFDRISADPAVLGGKPCIKGTRLSVEFILELIASKATHDQIVQRYPQLTLAGVEQAVLFAAHSLKNSTFLNERLAG
ncbi:MAG: DUF433 domain-containing protein [Phycisphaerales bacterium]